MATIRNLTIDQGSTFGATISILDDVGNPYDLTGYTAMSDIRKVPTSSTVTASFTASIPTPTSGGIYLQLTDEEAAAIKHGRYMYDVFIEDGAGRRYRAIEGMVEVTPAITR